MSTFCIMTRCCFRRSLLYMDTWPLLKFTLNLKSRKCSLYNQIIQNSSFVHYQERLNLFHRPNSNKKLNLFNLNKNNYLYHTRRLLCCNSTISDNILCKVQDNHNVKVMYRTFKCHQSVLYPHLCKNIFSRTYSSKKPVFSSKDSAIKRHEYIKGVLREKQRRIRQTQQHLKRSGRLLLNDIKETKSKMKEKMEEIIERENIWTFPNLLCVARIAVTPYLGYLIICEDYKLALVFVVFAGVTDMLDGLIARTFKSQSSKLGSFLDPMADKVLISTLFLTLTVSGNIPVPLTVLIIARDVVLFGAGFYIRYQSLPPPRTLSRYFDMTHATAQLAPTTISKVNTMIQLTTVLTTLTAVVFEYSDHPALHALWYLTAGSTIASALSYLTTKNTYKILKKKKSR